MNMIYSNYLGDLFSALPLLLLFLMIIICYVINGFAGLLFGASGYSSLFIVFNININIYRFMV